MLRLRGRGVSSADIENLSRAPSARQSRCRPAAWNSGCEPGPTPSRTSGRSFRGHVPWPSQAAGGPPRRPPRRSSRPGAAGESPAQRQGTRPSRPRPIRPTRGTCRSCRPKADCRSCTTTCAASASPGPSGSTRSRSTKAPRGWASAPQSVAGPNGAAARSPVPGRAAAGRHHLGADRRAGEPSHTRDWRDPEASRTHVIQPAARRTDRPPQQRTFNPRQAPAAAARRNQDRPPTCQDTEETGEHQGAADRGESARSTQANTNDR